MPSIRPVPQNPWDASLVRDRKLCDGKGTKCGWDRESVKAKRPRFVVHPGCVKHGENGRRGVR